jgi:hypothetical protein
MAITVKHSKVSTIPDDADTSLVRPSDWNADHTLVGTVPVANGGTGAATLTGYVKGNGTATMTASATVPSTDITGLGTMSTQNSNNISVTGGSISGTTVAGYIPTTEKAAALGVATLDAGGTVPLSQIPASIQGGVSYQGTWNAATNTPTLSNGVGVKGYYYVVSVAGSTNLDGITAWNVGDWAIFNGTVWQKVDNTDAVTSVNGYTGTVVLTAADVSAVPYTGATGAVDLNAKSLVNVSNLGVNTTTVPTIAIRAIGNNNSTSRIAMRGYSSDANSSAIRVTKFRGTAGAPQAPQSGDSLGKFELAGYGTTSSEGYPQASLEGLATEAWGATARGTKAVIKVTPNTTTTQVTALTIDQNSAATFASSVTATSFSGSGSGLTSIPNSALTNSAITINGTSTSLGGSISVGTVTSVTGTSPVVSSGGATPAISMPAATTSVNGYLTSTDWNTFNNKGSGTVTSVSATSPVTSTGGATPTIAMPAATTSVSGYLTSTDWTTFNNKSNTNGTVTSVAATAGTGISVSGSPITTSGTLTITNTAPDQTVALTAGTGISTTGTYPNFTITNTAPSSGGTVTSVAALTLGTTGTDLSSTVATGTTTPVITLQVPTASATNRGALSAADWTTFNNKGSGTVTTVSVTSANGFAGTSSGGATPALTLSTSISGILKGNGTAISAATSGTDYSAGTSALSTGIVKSTTTTGALTIAVAADFPTLNQNTTGTAANVTGTVAIANGGTGQTTYTNGQILIGNTTGNTLTKTTLTAGTGISVTNGAGSITINNTTAPYSATYLVVAGGGGGGASGNGGGGGAGGLLTGTTSLTIGTTYSATVGSGGASASNGANSSLGTIATAIGGGNGCSPAGAAGSGGSGGGGANDSTDYAGGAGTSGQGNAGGNSGGGGSPYPAGGGGGAGAAGAVGTTSGIGGVGLSNSITGSAVFYAGGGGGARSSGSASVGGNGGGGNGGVASAGVAGTANTGGGGGGAGGGGAAGAGGSGVVILSVPTANYTGTTTGSPTVTTSGSNTIMQFNASGSYTA